MKITRLEITNTLGVRRFAADLSAPLQLIAGRNGAGKSSLLQAVRMALTGEAMAPQRRAFGMGVFFSFYFVLMTAGPPIAGWLFDRTGSAYTAIVFAAGLFAPAALCFVAFGPLKRRLSRPNQMTARKIMKPTE